MLLDTEPAGSGKAARPGHAPAPGDTSGWSHAWQRTALTLGLVWALVLLLFFPTAAQMVGIWTSSTAFNHCFLIGPIIGWLVWQRRDALRELEPRPYPPALVLLAAAAFLWLLGWMASLSLAMHIALVLILQASAFVVLGPQVTRALLFPLAFMIFLAPFGEELIPWLQVSAANFAVAALKFFGVPVVTDSVLITIPNGQFKVAEECSGFRFLLAGMSLAALYSNLAFKTWRKQAIVIALGLIVPILANWVRVFGIIYIAHLSTPDTAKLVDNIVSGHEFYGWLFFGLIMLIMFSIGRMFSDKMVDDPAIDISTWVKQPAPVGAARLRPAIAAAALVVAAAAPAFAWWSDRAGGQTGQAEVQAPVLYDWAIVPADAQQWKPVYPGASAESFVTYLRNGRTVQLYLALYERETNDNKLITHANGAAPPQSPWTWLRNLPAPVMVGSERIETFAFQIRAGDGERDVWQWYWVNDRLVTSPYLAKLESLKARLLGGNRRAGVIILSATQNIDGTRNLDQMAALLHDFGPLEAAARAWFNNPAIAAGQAE